MTYLPISKNWKKGGYNLILVIINKLTKNVYYKPVKTIINTFKQAEVIIDVIVIDYDLLDYIMSNKNMPFMLNSGYSYITSLI